MTTAEIVADVAARIKAADQESADAAAAFATGRGKEWWEKKAKEVLDRVESAGGDAIGR